MAGEGGGVLGPDLVAGVSRTLGSILEFSTGSSLHLVVITDRASSVAVGRLLAGILGWEISRGRTFQNVNRLYIRLQK